MIFRMRVRRLGDHFHCTLFVGWAGFTFSNCGELVMREAEFAAFREQATFIDWRMETERPARS